VTLTALARISTPLRILALPSFENLISLCAPRVNKGVETLLTALAAARRRDLDDVVDRRCIVLFFYSEEMVVRGEEVSTFFFELARKNLEKHVTKKLNIAPLRSRGHWHGHGFWRVQAVAYYVEYFIISTSTKDASMFRRCKFEVNHFFSTEAALTAANTTVTSKETGVRVCGRIGHS
jgi:hypothetical protein